MKRISSSDIFSKEFYEYDPPFADITEDVVKFLPERTETDKAVKAKTVNRTEYASLEDFIRVTKKLRDDKYKDVKEAISTIRPRDEYEGMVWSMRRGLKEKHILGNLFQDEPTEQEIQAAYKDIINLEQSLDPSDPDKDKKLRILRQKKQDLDEFHAMRERAHTAHLKDAPLIELKENVSFHTAAIARDIIQNWLTKLSYYLEDPLDRYPIIKYKTPSDIMVEANIPYFRNNYPLVSILNWVYQKISRLPIFDQGRRHELVKELAFLQSWRKTTLNRQIKYLTNLWLRNILALRPIEISRCYLALEDWPLFRLPDPLPNEITRIIFPLTLDGISVFIPGRDENGYILNSGWALLEKLTVDGYFVFDKTLCSHTFMTEEKIDEYFADYDRYQAQPNLIITWLCDDSEESWRNTNSHAVMAVVDKRINKDDPSMSRWRGFMIDPSKWFETNCYQKFRLDGNKFWMYVGMQCSGAKLLEDGSEDPSPQGRIVHAITPWGYMGSMPSIYGSLEGVENHYKHYIDPKTADENYNHNIKVLANAISADLKTNPVFSWKAVNTDAQKHDQTCGTWASYFCFHYALLDRDYEHNSLAFLPLDLPPFDIKILTLEKTPQLNFVTKTVPMNARYFQEFLKYVFTEFTKEPYGHGEIEDKKEESKDGVNDRCQNKSSSSTQLKIKGR